VQSATGLNCTSKGVF